MLVESDAPDRIDRDREDNPAPDSRPYVHDRCGQITVVSGHDFSRLANPFAFVSQTYCVVCQTFVSLRSVAWADTGESIAAYRRRLRAEAPMSLKLVGWGIGPLVCAGLGAGIGWLFTPNQSKGPLIGGVTALILAVGGLMLVLSRWVWGIDYRAVK
jgi:hypothetical protein